MLRISCHTCGSLFLVSELPAGPPLCPACGTVGRTVNKSKRRKSKTAVPAEKRESDGTGSPS